MIKTNYAENINKFNFAMQNIIDNIELLDEICALDHKDDNKYKAVDYLCQSFKDKVDRIDILKIPICAECAEALCGNEWVLIYCIYCNKSQLVYKPKAKLKYKDSVHVIWLDICPWCTEVTDDYYNVG